MREQQKHRIQRRLQFFELLPIICGIGIIPLIVIANRVMDNLGVPAGIGFFFGGLGFLGALSVGAILQSRKIKSELEE